MSGPTVNETINRETRSCDECGSEYFADASLMAKLCLDCAHRLYGYPPCAHVFRDGRCSDCGSHENRGARIDWLGYAVFAIPPLVGAIVAVGGRVDQFVVIPVLLAVANFSDAKRWRLPRWLWIPLFVFLWPLALPGYAFIRRFNGAKAHWGFGLASVAAWFFLLTNAPHLGLAR